MENETLVLLLIILFLLVVNLVVSSITLSSQKSKDGYEQTLDPEFAL